MDFAEASDDGVAVASVEPYSKHTKTKQNKTYKILNLNQHANLRTDHMCDAHHCAQLTYTTQHTAVLIISLLSLQTDITAQTLSIEVDG